MNNFHLQLLNKQEIENIVMEWENNFSKKIYRLENKKANKAFNKTINAKSIAEQIISTVNQRHGYLLAAMKEGKCRAILIADDCTRGIFVRFLLSNILDPDSKGAGTFLIQNLLDRETESIKIFTTPQNSTKYWQRLGFRECEEDPTQMVHQTPPAEPEPTSARTIKGKKK